MLELGVGLELGDAEAPALGTLRTVCLDAFAVVCTTWEDADVLLTAEDVEDGEEDVEEVVEDVEVVIAAEAEVKNDPSVAT